MRRMHVGLMVALVPVPMANAALLEVPGQYPTIQEAIDAAGRGDTVVVAPGIYREHIDFRGKQITVRSRAPDQPECVQGTVIDGEHVRRGVTFSGGERRSTRLLGFTIANGYARVGGGILCERASPTISQCRIIHCSVQAEDRGADSGSVLLRPGYGGGICIDQACMPGPIISDCLISDCHAHPTAQTPASGGGLCVYRDRYSEQPQITIVGNTFSDCTAAHYDGGGVHSYGSQCVIRDNTFRRCGSTAVFAYHSGLEVTGNRFHDNINDAIACARSWSEVVIRGNTIQDTISGRGINVWGSEWVEVVKNVVRRNENGGIRVGASQVTIRRNEVRENTSSGNGAGILLDPVEVGFVQDNDIIGNTGPEESTASGGGIYCNARRALIVGNRILDNATGRRHPWSFGGGVACSDLTSDCCVRIVDNIIERNWGAIGGGIGLVGSPARQVIRRNLICQNEALFAGGGVMVHASQGHLIGNTIDRNTAPQGGNVAVYRYWPRIENCLITYAPDGGGIEVVDLRTPPEMRFCDVHGNTRGGAVVDFVGFPENPIGRNGNISVNPLYADAASGDYHLISRRGRWTPDGWVRDRLHSPCIDRGPRFASESPEPAPNGGRRNLGAYGNTEFASMTYRMPEPKPDMMIREAGTGRWMGDDIYSPTGQRQRKWRVVRPNETAIYELQVQNDEPVEDAFLITGAARDRDDVTVTYYDALSGGSDITREVSTLGWMTAPLAPGRMRRFRVEITAHGCEVTTPDALSVDVRISASSVADAKCRADAVRVIINVDCESPAAQIGGLSCVPTAAGVQVTFSLSAAATVEARVRNIAGRPVRTICTARECESGINTLVWNGRGDEGLPVPSGIYLVEVVAKNAAGAQSRALTQVAVTR